MSQKDLLGQDYDDLEAIKSARRNVNTVISTVQDAVDSYHRVVGWYQGKIRWTVTVDSDDRLYDLAHHWFTSEDVEAKPVRNIKVALSAVTRRGRRMPTGYYDDECDGPPELDLLFNDDHSRHVDIGGHKITVDLVRHAPPPRRGEQTSMVVVPDSLSFHAKSYDGQQAVLSHLRQLAADTDKRKPALHLLSTWGDWSKRDDLPARSLESVVLRSGQMERLREDVERFLDAEDEYVRRGMPYHRGYLLHGPPGTGKTSIVRALAASLGLDLWYAPLGDLQKDSSLMNLINQVKAGGILLLEDVDVYQATRERDDEGGDGVSMAGLLNALDGVATPHGLIVFLTTNDLSVIDPAVLRPGRVDLLEEIGLPDNEQIIRLYNYWYRDESNVSLAFADRVQWTGSTAALTNAFKSLDASKAWEMLRRPAESVDVRPVSSRTGHGGKHDRERVEASS